MHITTMEIQSPCIAQTKAMTHNALGEARRDIISCFHTGAQRGTRMEVVLARLKGYDKRELDAEMCKQDTCPRAVGEDNKEVQELTQSWFDRRITHATKSILY